MTTPLVTPTRGRLAAERTLRAQGYVRLTATDAPFTAYDQLLPSCSVQQVTSTLRRHGRILWSHPGPSGLDPRAVAPLALVRVADGLGPDPLDPPTTLVDAARWLLAEDITDWPTRPRHRTPIGIGGVPCLWEGEGFCSSHPDWDEELHEVGEALGDRTRPCSAFVWPATGGAGWTGVGASLTSTDLPQVGYQALWITQALGEAYRRGHRGSLAWDLARHGDTDVPERLGVVPPPATRPNPGGRGMHWYAAFSLSKRGRGNEVKACPFCDAKCTNPPCDACVREGRTRRVGVEEWHSYLPLAAHDIAYPPGDPGPSIPCGHPSCPTPVALSTSSNEGVRR